MSVQGPFVIDVAGTALTSEDRELLEHPAVGGVILFTRNYEAPAQLKALCAALARIRRAQPLLVTVDHEGGRVQRFRDGFTVLPPARDCRDEAAAFAQGRTLATELRAHGVHLNYAPVLDLDRGLGSVIGDRAFAADPARVAALGVAWIDGMRAGGMAACAKHFPGHGGVEADSHHELPVDPRGADAIAAEDLVPFRAAIAAGVESVMMAHVLFPSVDDRPASLSSHWIRQVLRGELGFTGAVVCDDLSMAGAAGCGSYTDRALAALDAGCDVLPVCNARDGAVEILDGVRVVRDDARAARWRGLWPK